MHLLKNGHPAHTFTDEDRRKAAAVTNTIRREKRALFEQLRLNKQLEQMLAKDAERHSDGPRNSGAGARNRPRNRRSSCGSSGDTGGGYDLRIRPLNEKKRAFGTSDLGDAVSIDHVCLNARVRRLPTG
jgi:hypothetical protein